MFKLGDIITMKKPHACGENRWEVIRLGADIKVKCLGCGHIVMIPRAEFKKKFKKVLTQADQVNRENQAHYLKHNTLLPSNLIKRNEA